mgnify:CR=1 FL=1
MIDLTPKGKYMKKKKLLTALIGASFILSGMASAQAVTLYADAKYKGAPYTSNGTSYAGDAFNDKASSLRSYGQHKYYYEDLNYRGGGFGTNKDSKNLGEFKIAFSGNGNDTISSFK